MLYQIRELSKTFTGLHCYEGVTISSCNVVFFLWLLQVTKTYSNGTYRAGAMRQISLVGAVDEEVGDYFPEFLGMLEESPFLKVSHNI